MNPDKRIFLTGGTGFVGSHVLRRLLELDRRVVVLSRSGRNNRHLRDFDHPAMEVVTGDLLRPETFRKALAECDEVMHIAGVISFQKSDEQKMFELNYEVTKNLWDCCIETKPDKIMYLGSIFAHGCSGTGEPVDEDFEFDDELLRLRVPYLHAKRKAELLSWEHHRAGRLNITFGYPGFCIGPGDHNLSSMRVVSQLLKGRLPFYVGGGIHFIDIRDAADGLIKCLDNGELGRKYIIGGHNLSWQEFFALVSKVSGRPPPRVKLNYGLGTFMGKWMERVGLGAILSEGDVEVVGQTWFYDSSRSVRELDLALRPLETSLRDGIDWLRAEGLAP